MPPFFSIAARADSLEGVGDHHQLALQVAGAKNLDRQAGVRESERPEHLRPDLLAVLEAAQLGQVDRRVDGS